MKICFNALAPDKTIRVNVDGKDKLFRNGSVVDIDRDYALIFVRANLAFEIKNEEDEKEVIALQKLEQKNAGRRLEIQNKVKEMQKRSE